MVSAKRATEQKQRRNFLAQIVACFDSNLWWYNKDEIRVKKKEKNDYKQ